MSARTNRVYVHPLPVRLWHWLNAFGFIALVLVKLVPFWLVVLVIFRDLIATLVHMVLAPVLG